MRFAHHERRKPAQCFGGALRILSRGAENPGRDARPESTAATFREGVVTNVAAFGAPRDKGIDAKRMGQHKKQETRRQQTKNQPEPAGAMEAAFAKLKR